MLSKPWKTCPISWKNVTTSSCLISAGLSGVGFARFATMAVTGKLRLPLGKSYPGTRGHTAAWEYLASAKVGNRIQKERVNIASDSLQ